MNILIAASYATPQSGNFIASVLELGLQLRKQGDDLFFIFPKRDNTLREDSWVTWLKENKFTVFLVDTSVSEQKMLNELLDIIRKYEIDILHTHFGMYGKIITKYRSRLPKKILVHHHSGFVYNQNKMKQVVWNIVKSLQYRFLKISIACVNKDIAENYKLAKHWFVPNGLSLERHVRSSRTREECRKELGIGADEKVCLFLGWDLYRKGLDVAVKAVDLCRKEDASVVLGIVGVGAPPREKALDYIRERTECNPGAEWIHFFPDTEDMFAYHRAADVFLSASRSEGFPYGVLESISQNTPVVVSDIPETRWALSFERVFSYPIEDPSACAKVVRMALDSGRSNINAEALMKRYGIKKWCDEMISIYHMV